MARANLMIRSLRLVLLIVGELAVPAGCLGAIPPRLVRQLRAADAAVGDEFGEAVALDGRLGVIGASHRDELGSNSGAAYVFDVWTGEQLFKLVPEDGATEDGFGSSVAIDGNRVIVGAMLDDDDGASSGSAYVFDIVTGRQLWKLRAPDASADDEFGVSVALQGDWALVGAHKDGSGSAHLFDISTGQQVRKLVAADAAPDDRFGVAVAIDQGRALIGARWDDDLAVASGAAYLFDVSSGQQLHKLTSHDGDRGDRHGQHLDLEGDRAVVASRYDDDAVKSSGSAYIYDVSTGREEYKVVAPDADPHDHFGSAVSASGNLAIIGAAHDSDLGFFSGSAYLFDLNSRQPLFKFTAPDPQQFDEFGQSVAMDGSWVLIGASMEDFPQAPGLPSGKAYVYLLPEPTGWQLAGSALLMLAWRPWRAAQLTRSGVRRPTQVSLPVVRLGPLGH